MATLSKSKRVGKLPEGKEGGASDGPGLGRENEGGVKEVESIERSAHLKIAPGGGFSNEKNKEESSAK